MGKQLPLFRRRRVLNGVCLFHGRAVHSVSLVRMKSHFKARIAEQFILVGIDTYANVSRSCESSVPDASVGKYLRVRRYYFCRAVSACRHLIVLMST